MWLVMTVVSVLFVTTLMTLVVRLMRHHRMAAKCHRHSPVKPLAQSDIEKLERLQCRAKRRQRERQHTR